MNEEPIEPLSAELAAMLARARDVPPVDPAMAGRLRARLDASLGGGGGGGVSVAGRVVRAAALVGLGAIGGAGAHAWLSRPAAEPAPAPVIVARQELPTATSLRAAAAPTPVAASPTAVGCDVDVDTPAPAPPRPDAQHAADALARERTIVDAARGALAHGRAADALAALDRHARLYPHGQLADMREALAVQALMRAGRVDEARSRAVAFGHDYPDSLLRPGVQAALTDTP